MAPQQPIIIHPQILMEFSSDLGWGYQDNRALSVTKKRLGQLNRSPASLKSVDVANVKCCRRRRHGRSSLRLAGAQKGLALRLEHQRRRTAATT